MQNNINSLKTEIQYIKEKTDKIVELQENMNKNITEVIIDNVKTKTELNSIKDDVGDFKNSISDLNIKVDTKGKKIYEWVYGVVLLVVVLITLLKDVFKLIK